MDEYGNIYYVGDTRNADHRTGVVGFPWGRPPTTVPAPVTTRPLPPVQAMPPAPPVYYQAPTWNPNVWNGQPGYWNQQPPAPSPLSSLFGNMHAGQVIGLIAEALAAFRSLPSAPEPTRDPATDVANGIVYDKALAQHAKTDEQIRTIGHLVAKMVR